jgi:hypothetical protein
MKEQITVEILGELVVVKLSAIGGITLNAFPFS